MSIFFVIPMLIVLTYAFLTKGTYGGVQMIFTLKNFNVFFDPIFLKVLFRTIYISVIVTFFTVALAIPTAYFIARSRYKQELLILVIIPFWTNFLIRIYAWISILGSNGFLNTILIKLGIIETPLKLLYNTGSVVLITVYTSLPFAILPLYAIIEKFDFALVEAARDLGATNRQAFFKVFLPNIKSGIVTAVLFTFIPAMGSYAVPRLVGGTQATMLGNIIAQHLTVTRNWPLASAISAMLILVTSVALLIFMRSEKKSKEVSDE
ncbi:ABC transporter permease [Cetobacterium sp.]|uniref:ABC transporter permease n=1 Tax=Cetobacterium sp. TaxID=2071632 RepID=UPI002FCAE24E